MSRPPETDAALARVLAALQEHGVLLQAGSEFPSIANIVAGEVIRGSWWAHPGANLIYWVCQDLERDTRVSEARLLAGKVTHVWDAHLPDLIAIAGARSEWQMSDLSAPARRLLDRVDAGDVDTSTLQWDARDGKLGDVCRLLERRLLVRSFELHTTSGRHSKRLSSWTSWWRELGGGRLPESEAARLRIEALVGAPAHRLLPWAPRRTRA